MSYKTYRLCLMGVLVLAILAGVFYYLNRMKHQTRVTEGTLVYLEDDRYFEREQGGHLAA